MAIDRVEIKDFLVFKGEFVCDFCPGVNVLIGANATGKTTLLKEMYRATETFIGDKTNGLADDVVITYPKGNKTIIIPKESAQVIFGVPQRNDFKVISTGVEERVFIPEKDILEHAKGLLTFIEQKQTGFGQIYKDVLINALDIPTQVQSEIQQKVSKIIIDTIGGVVRWDKSEGSFYTLRTDGVRIPFANEASGYKKLGFLGLLVTSGQLKKGSILFWDEPENSLNPELMPTLVEILLKLQSNGVQIFIATHNSNLAQLFDIKWTDRDSLQFCNLSKNDDGTIRCDNAASYSKLYMDATEEILTLGPGIVRVFSFAYLLMGINIVTSYYLQALKQSINALIVSLSRGFVICLILMTLLPAIVGFNAIWLTMPLTELLTLFVALKLLRKNEAERLLAVLKTPAEDGNRKCTS
ncbi:MAG: AAA family ATPase [Synergistaceae bacterium]|jgi:energy-coupling factor transporter ATP-binding protein EcfA2|nr:AAA family ATPase [Synergistaceae bacterium]